MRRLDGMLAGVVMLVAMMAAVFVSPAAAQPAKKPNILVIWGDDIGQSNLSVSTKGMMGYWDWYFDHVYLLVPMQAYVGQFLATFKEYPPRQKAASFSIDQVMEQLTGSLGSKLAWAPDRRGGQPGGGAARAVGLGRAISAA